MEIFVWPHTSQFNVDNDLNYQFWLRNDHSRETAYRKAIEDLRKSKSAKSILDAGTGTGVWAIAMALAFPKAKVDAIDLHKENIDLAKASLGNFPTVQNNVSFKIVDINQYAPDKKYDIICTELDGGLGNNEGAKKAFKSLQKLLTPNGTIIPLKIDTYTVPVSLEGINEKLPNTGANPFLKNLGIIIKNPYSCYYLVYGVDSSSLLAESKILDTIKEKGLVNVFDEVLSTTSNLKDTFLSFVSSLNITMGKMANMLAYTFLIPLLPQLYEMAQTGYDQNTVNQIIKRILSYGAIIGSSAIVRELIKKIVNRFRG